MPAYSRSCLGLGRPWRRSTTTATRAITSPAAPKRTAAAPNGGISLTATRIARYVEPQTTHTTPRARYGRNRLEAVVMEPAV